MSYINISRVCDGLADCSNIADEQPSLCPNSTQSRTSTVNDLDVIPCEREEFVCANGQCIPMDSVCDGVHQCSDGTDEGPRCSKLIGPYCIFRYLSELYYFWTRNFV